MNSIASQGTGSKNCWIKDVQERQPLLLRLGTAQVERNQRCACDVNVLFTTRFLEKNNCSLHVFPLHPKFVLHEVSYALLL